MFRVAVSAESAGSISDASAAGLVVRTWGIAGSETALKRAYESGAVGTTVDWPAKAREIIESF